EKLAEDQQVQNILVVGRQAAWGTQNAQIHATDDREAEQDAHGVNVALAIEHDAQPDDAPDGEGGVQDLRVGSQEADGHDQHEDAGQKEHDGAGNAAPAHQVALFKAGASGRLWWGGVPIPPGEHSSVAPEVVIAHHMMRPQIGGWLLLLPGSDNLVLHEKILLLSS